MDQHNSIANNVPPENLKHVTFFLLRDAAPSFFLKYDLIGFIDFCKKHFLYPSCPDPGRSGKINLNFLERLNIEKTPFEF